MSKRKQPKLRPVAWFAPSGVKGVWIRVDTTVCRNPDKEDRNELVYFWRLETDTRGLLQASWRRAPHGFPTKTQALESGRYWARQRKWDPEVA